VRACEPGHKHHVAAVRQRLGVKRTKDVWSGAGSLDPAPVKATGQLKVGTQCICDSLEGPGGRARGPSFDTADIGLIDTAARDELRLGRLVLLPKLDYLGGVPEHVPQSPRGG